MRVDTTTGCSPLARWPIAGGIVTAACGLWYYPFEIVPYDYAAWMGAWYEHFTAVGRLAGFSGPVGNYTPPYLYLLSATSLLDGILRPLIAVKMLSTAGALWVVYSVYRLLRDCGVTFPLERALWSLLLPTIFFNVAVLAQADVFWIAPCVLAVAAAIRRNPLPMVLWASLGFTFKAQAVFIAPFVMAMLVRFRAPLWHWLLPFFVYSVAMLPAWIAGWPAANLATVYLRQVEWLPADGRPFISNTSNPWVLARLFARDLAERSFWIGYVAAAAGSLGFVVWVSRHRLVPAQTIAAAALSSAMLPFLLPGMHERFFALAEILAFAYAFAVRDRRAVATAALMQVALVASFAGWKTQSGSLMILGLGLLGVALVLIVGYLSRDPADQHIGEMVVDAHEPGVNAKPVRRYRCA